jgi:hypothetical protein
MKQIFPVRIGPSEKRPKFNRFFFYVPGRGVNSGYLHVTYLPGVLAGVLSENYASALWLTIFAPCLIPSTNLH